ncbi:uncharacterized protein RCC_00319 [Ramularia collo-cygni]|uniref:F-box domain-containing protein n=1 Tax=Ramularia collo-cygni TaxID=112498 RepID=A0A2D3ULB1_9PEZI|nr:uncharacterized protein RCC_00319 [Ramularia collo-cygni]CZT14342.1 uncharacterized protein RCC_00319 [Ramularia collo-cygni]
MSPLAECHILELPVEVLQLIVAASPVRRAFELHTLRLVCKAFDAAVFDAWAEIWISHLWCYLLDSQRMERLQAITSRKHLSSKIQTISFSLDPWEDESRSQIQIVPTMLQSINISRWKHVLKNEQADFHEAHRKHMYDNYQLPASGALEAIFANLTSSCKLELDLRVICSQSDPTTKVEQDRHQIVDAIVGTQFPGLRELTLFNTEVSPDVLLEFLQRSSNSLEELTIDGTSLDRHSKDGEDANVSLDDGYLAALLQTLLDRTKLQYLRLDNFMVSGQDFLFFKGGFFKDGGSRVERVELDGGMDIAAFLRLNIEHADEIFVREV